MMFNIQLSSDNYNLFFNSNAIVVCKQLLQLYTSVVIRLTLLAAVSYMSPSTLRAYWTRWFMRQSRSVDASGLVGNIACTLCIAKQTETYYNKYTTRQLAHASRKTQYAIQIATTRITLKPVTYQISAVHYTIIYTAQTQYHGYNHCKYTNQ